jgi:hypothetical protein
MNDLATLTDTAAQLETIAEFLSQPALTPLAGFGVSLGKGGSILFHSHYAAYSGQAAHYDHAQRQLELALGELSPATYQPAFATNYYQELAELGQLVGYLTTSGHLDWDAAAVLSQFDTLLAERLRYFIAKRQLDIVNGALSVGTYFLRRLAHSPIARGCLDTLLDALKDLREGTPATGYYWTCHVIVEPRVYTGISHGSAMIINFLAAMHEAGIRPDDCAELMHFGLRYLLGARMDPAQFISSFPLWQGKLEPTNNMCLVYGDLGTAYAMHRAASLLHDGATAAIATEVALLTTTRHTPEETYIQDASVWYGASGAYLLYQALGRQTKNPAFAVAASYWLRRIPEMATHGPDYAGFSSFFYREQRTVQLGFSFGLAGIGLTLLQALSHGRYALDEFAWLA